jgi:hypothetical protein
VRKNDAYNVSLILPENSLLPRNPEYETRTLSKAEAADVTVFGRVRWRGGAV